MATKLTPLHDRILVRRVEEAETTKGGIIIPETAKEKPQEGEVISVGKGKVNEEGKVHPLDVKAGDRVLFGKYSGNEITIDGELFVIMREEEVLRNSGRRDEARRREEVVAFELRRNRRSLGLRPRDDNRRKCVAEGNSKHAKTSEGAKRNGKANRSW